MSELSEQILEYIDKHATLDTLQYSKSNQLDHQKVIGAVKSIQTYEGVIIFMFYMTESNQSPALNRLSK